MGNAEVDIRPLVEVVKMKLQDVADKTIVKKLVPTDRTALQRRARYMYRRGR